MSLWTRARNVFRGDALNREIAEEMESHLAEAVAAGRDPHEARRAFGSMAREREASYQARVVGWMDSLRADVSFGWGQLMKRKVATAAAVLSLALAIGACTSAFRLVDALSPEIILIAGDVTSAWDKYAPVIQAELDRSTWKRSAPRLLPTHEGDVARLRGAAALLLQRHSIRS